VNKPKSKSNPGISLKGFRFTEKLFEINIAVFFLLLFKPDVILLIIFKNNTEFPGWLIFRGGRFLIYYVTANELKFKL